MRNFSTALYGCIVCGMSCKSVKKYGKYGQEILHAYKQTLAVTERIFKKITPCPSHNLSCSAPTLHSFQTRQPVQSLILHHGQARGSVVRPQTVCFLRRKATDIRTAPCITEMPTNNKHEWLNSEINPTRCNNCVYSSQWLYSTCFEWQFHPSSGVHMLYMASGRQVYLCCNFVSIMVVLSL